MSAAQPTPGPWHREGYGGSEIVGADGEGVCRIYKVDGERRFDPTTPAGDVTEANAAVIVRLANLYFAGKAASARNDAEIKARGDLPADKEYGLTEAEIACAQMMNGLFEESEALVKALNSANGYLTNAAIDLETSASKKTALATINGGIKMVREALAKVGGP